MLKCKNIGVLTKQNLKIICLYDMLRAYTFGACRKSLRASHAPAYERARNFLRHVLLVFFKDLEVPI